MDSMQRLARQRARQRDEDLINALAWIFFLPLLAPLALFDLLSGPPWAHQRRRRRRR